MSKKMNIEEFEICMDITTRMALFALSLAANKETLPLLFDGIKTGLVDMYPKDKTELISKLVDQYKAAVIATSDELK